MQTQHTFKNGFTMVEVLIASIIFVLAAAGMLAFVGNMTRPAATASRETTAAVFGKTCLDEMRDTVDAETWQSGRLTTGGTRTWNTITIAGTTYTATYTVAADPITSGRFVNLTVGWAE